MNTSSNFWEEVNSGYVMHFLCNWPWWPGNSRLGKALQVNPYPMLGITLWTDCATMDSRRIDFKVVHSVATCRVLYACVCLFL